MSDMLVRIKRAVIAGHYAFSSKARDEMETDRLTELDVAEAILLCVTLPERTVVEEIVLSPTRTRDQTRDIQVARDLGAPPGAK